MQRVLVEALGCTSGFVMLTRLAGPHAKLSSAWHHVLPVHLPVCLAYIPLWPSSGACWTWACLPAEGWGWGALRRGPKPAACRNDGTQAAAQPAVPRPRHGITEGAISCATSADAGNPAACLHPTLLQRHVMPACQAQHPPSHTLPGPEVPGHFFLPDHQNKKIPLPGLGSEPLALGQAWKEAELWGPKHLLTSINS